MVFLWALAYSLTYLTAEIFTRLLSLPSFVPSAAMILYTAALLLWICQSGRAAEIGLHPLPKASPKQYASLLPLFLLPVYNLLTIQQFPKVLSSLVLSLCAAVTEEIFFRGFLLRALGNYSKLAGILLSSVIFALFHCANLLRAGDSNFVLLQVFCSFAAGLCFGASAVVWQSILPCILAHLAINLTGSLASSPPGSHQLIGLCVCAGIYICYGIRLFRKVNSLQGDKL